MSDFSGPNCKASPRSPEEEAQAIEAGKEFLAKYPQDFSAYSERCAQRGIDASLNEATFSVALRQVRLQCGSTAERVEAVKFLQAMTDADRTEFFKNTGHLRELIEGTDTKTE